MKGKLIVIEGLDGSGKSTQIECLKNKLNGKNVHRIKLPDYDSAIYINKKAKTNKEACLKALNLLRPVLDGITEWTEPVIHDTVMAAIAEAGMKNATALWPLRIAISGQQSTPGGAIEIAYLLGKEETLRRVDDGIRRVSEMPDA